MISALKPTKQTSNSENLSLIDTVHSIHNNKKVIHFLKYSGTSDDYNTLIAELDKACLSFSNYNRVSELIVPTVFTSQQKFYEDFMQSTSINFPHNFADNALNISDRKSVV